VNPTRLALPTTYRMARATALAVLTFCSSVYAATLRSSAEAPSHSSQSGAARAPVAPAAPPRVTILFMGDDIGWGNVGFTAGVDEPATRRARRRISGGAAAAESADAPPS
jgi:hypothetical protein